MCAFNPNGIRASAEQKTGATRKRKLWDDLLGEYFVNRIAAMTNWRTQDTISKQIHIGVLI